jgi:TonB family protein
MSFVLNVIAKPTIILIGAALLSMLLRRSSASLRHAVWMLALVAAVVVPVAGDLVPRFDLQVLKEPSTTVTFLPIPNVVTTGGERELKLSTTESFQRRWLQLQFVWILGAAILIGRLLKGAMAVRQTAATASLASDDDWLKLINELCASFGIEKPVCLLFSEQLVSPMTWGFRQQTILLPRTAATWSDDRRRLVLAHELAHVKRNDGLLQIFAQIGCSIYWFNPLLWYAAHRVHIERERACDDRVLTLGTPAVDYADHLIQIVRGLRDRSVAFAAVSMAQPSQLETRLVSILDTRLRRRTLSKIGAVTLCTLAVLLTASIAAIGVTTAVPLPPVIMAAVKIAPPEPERKAPAPAAKPQRTRIGDGSTVPNSAMTPPRVVEFQPPTYTNEALLAHVEGTVTLEASVKVEGEVQILRVVKGLGYGLDEKAIEAVMGWKFAPATRNGAPVDAVTQVDVDFTFPVWYSQINDDAPPVRVGPGITPPKVIVRVQPQYTDEARAAKYRGKVILQATVHQNGTVSVDKVVQELDYGLTPNAIEAIEQWKFQPGMRDGKAVSVTLNIEINFNLK